MLLNIYPPKLLNKVIQSIKIIPLKKKKKKKKITVTFCDKLQNKE